MTVNLKLLWAYYLNCTGYCPLDWYRERIVFLKALLAQEPSARIENAMCNLLTDFSRQRRLP